jgi:hypothetical protein
MSSNRTFSTSRPSLEPTINRWRRAEAWRAAGTEPTISEILVDPIVHLVMRRDGVAVSDVVGVLAAARASLGIEVGTVRLGTSGRAVSSTVPRMLVRPDVRAGKTIATAACSRACQ